MLDSGDVELFGMTYSAAYPSVIGYQRWVNHALAQNPDTRFFISVPWDDDPAGTSATQFEAEYEATEAAVHAIVDQLRDKFPGVDFYAVPVGRAAVELYKRYDNNDLPDVSALVGSPATALFGDAQGAPGDLLAAMGELVWFAAIYDIALDSYAYDPGYSTDIKALAAGVMDAHDPAYNAPDEVDVDSDGDGIVDRHDPNPLGRPNILMIMVDDLGFNDLAINNGNTEIDTPNLDQFAQDGVRFTRHYAAPVCSPARAALLTGLHPERVGFLPSGRGISPQMETLPERLQQEGYTTWHVGKWHVGHIDREAWPDHQGFDHWFGFLTQVFLAGQKENGELVPASPRYEDPWLQGDTEPGAYYSGHLGNVLTDKAIDVLSELHAQGTPWFLNLWYYAPHSPISPAAECAALYPDTEAGRYQALVNQVDANVGEVVAHLDSLGIGNETIVVVVSDNGGTNAQQNNNAPYFGTKTSMLEGGLRTPLLVRWTDPAVNGQVFGDTISIEDIYPTVLAAAGIDLPAGLDGLNFYPAIKQVQAAPQRDLFWQTGPTSYSVLSADGQYRYLQPGDFPVNPYQPVLYDLLADPSGFFPVTPIPPAIEDPMVAAFESWNQQVHLAATTYAQDAYGGGVLTGADFLRTPGFGYYTFGVGVPDGYSGPVAGQAGTWEMDISAGYVTVQMGPVQLSGTIASASTCHAVVVTGEFHRRQVPWADPDNIALELYIDGSLVDSLDMPATLPVADMAAPTFIGDPDAVAHGGTFSEPLVLNVPVDAASTWSVGDVSDTLCSP